MNERLLPMVKYVISCANFIQNTMPLCHLELVLFNLWDTCAIKYLT